MVTARIGAHGLSFDAIRSEFGLTEDFPPTVTAAAAAAIDQYAAQRQDATNIPFVTIDPPGSMDLDQAVCIERSSVGFTVYYAIADVAAWVRPGGAIDIESRKRGQTQYFPDGSVPLHPRELSENRASLLPNEIRPAALWTITCDATGEPNSWSVHRALVKSVARLDYVGVQAAADADTLPSSIAALPAFGRLRQAAALARGAVDVNLPDREIVKTGDTWSIVLAGRTESDEWNAHVSLLTGMCAARIMLDAGVGLLRTVPPAPSDAVSALRRAADALGLTWPSSHSVSEFLASLELNSPAALAMKTAAAGLLRGADYVPFGSHEELAAAPHREHAGIAAPYAHVTAPLRRLGDRFGTEICLAQCAGAPIPEWAVTSLAAVAAALRGTDNLAATVERAVMDVTEATVLASRVSEQFAAAVTRGANGKRHAEVFVHDPVVLARCDGNPPEGHEVTVTLTQADPATRTVRFAYQPPSDEAPRSPV